MFRNHERALGKVEHLALLDPDRRLRFERRTAMAAGARLMPNHMIGIGGLPQRAALVALLPAARLARAASQAARDPRFLLQPVARRRLGTVRTVLSQLSTKISDFSLEYRDLVLQRSDQLIDFGGKIHPTLQFKFPAPSLPSSSHRKKIRRNSGISDSPHLGSYERP